MDKNIWVVDDDESIRWVLEKGLEEGGMKVQTFDSANKVIKKLETENPQLILTDIRMPGPSGIDLLDKVKEMRPDIPVIIMTAHSDLDSAVEGVVDAIWFNQGQVCCAGSRLLIQESVEKLFIKKNNYEKN